MVVELAYQEVAVIDRRVAEKGIAGELHRALAIHDAMALVFPRCRTVRNVPCIGRGRLLFDLDKERVGVRRTRMALAVNDVVTQADGARSNDLETTSTGVYCARKCWRSGCSVLEY